MARVAVQAVAAVAAIQTVRAPRLAPGQRLDQAAGHHRAAGDQVGRAIGGEVALDGVLLTAAAGDAEVFTEAREPAQQNLAAALDFDMTHGQIFYRHDGLP